MENFALKGLSAPATISIDKWGMPHIRAQNIYDAFFVQGFNAVRDRLWQIDLWRKRGLGLLAADFGPGYLMQDRAARLFLYRGDIQSEWAAYGKDAESICTAFVSGINSGIDQIEQGRLPLPPEFMELDTKPARWEPDDVVRIRTHCLSRNANSELARAMIHRLADPEIDLLRAPLNPEVPESEWIKNSHVSLPVDALAIYELATAPVVFSEERMSACLEDAFLWNSVDSQNRVQRGVKSMEGSNNWAISGTKTKTGRAIMASDPHRLHSAPSLRYMVHLSAPGMNIIGAGEPSSPGIIAGHNGTSSFSLTIFCADQEDVIVYDTVPNDHTRYVYADKEEYIQKLTEIFAVKGYTDQKLELSFTRHGPVVFQDKKNHFAVAIRTVFTDPGTSPYMATLKTMRAKSMSEFQRASQTWGAPSVNLIYSDVSGDICWQPAAYIPRRTGWRGLMPVNGSGAFEWDGYLTAADLPAIENPACGFVYSANEMNLPADWDHENHPVGYEWFEDGRADRIADIISRGLASSILGSCELQTDTFSSFARRFLNLFQDKTCSPAFKLFAGWDGCSEQTSAASLLFEVWLSSHLQPALMHRIAPNEDLRKLLVPGDISIILEILEGKRPSLEAHCGLSEETKCQKFLQETLQDAWVDVRKRFGNNPSQWRWGDLHQGYFDHSLTPVKTGFDVGPFSKGGANSSVMLANYNKEDYIVRVGASVRMVIDVGKWDNSVWINAPGQSGVPGSIHYDDLAPLWARGEYVPMLYSEVAINEFSQQKINLYPA